MTHAERKYTIIGAFVFIAISVFFIKDITGAYNDSIVALLPSGSETSENKQKTINDLGFDKYLTCALFVTADSKSDFLLKGIVRANTRFSSHDNKECLALGGAVVAVGKDTIEVKSK